MNFDGDESPVLNRRDFLKTVATAALALGLPSIPSWAQDTYSSAGPTMTTRSIPGTDETIPVVGLGTWQQFDVRLDPQLLEPLGQVLETLFEQGGSVIDTSPMYGRAEQVLGELIDEEAREQAFLATKVWTRGKQSGIRQMEASMENLGVSTIDLVQVHNLTDWQTHLPTLKNWKDEGRIRYYGVTHYTGSAFDRLANVVENEELDFVQLPYSIAFRRAEERLLPLAQEHEVAVLVNRPFRAGSLFRQVQGEPLPEWVSEVDVNTWAQFFLKFILGHPAVTAVIPGTSDPEHMLDNARAGIGPLPNSDQRQRMVEEWESAS